MIRSKLLLTALFAIFALALLAGCVGVNGNPTELTGTWKYDYEETSGGTTTTKKSFTLEAKDTGDYTMKVKTETTVIATSSTTTNETTETGTYIGNINSVPKTVTCTTKDINNGTTTVTDTRSYTGTYDIITADSQTYLFLDINSPVSGAVDGKFVKQQ